MKHVMLFLVVGWCLSCGQKKTTLPDDVLSKEKFITVMIDMYSLEGKYSHTNVIDKPVYEKGVKEYETLFKKHGTSKEEVERSIDYYVRHPAEMKSIQSIILDSLNLRSTR